MVVGHTLGRRVVRRHRASFWAEIAKQEGLDRVLHYLDDFLAVGHSVSTECSRFLSMLTSLRLFLHKDITIVREVYPLVLCK